MLPKERIHNENSSDENNGDVNVATLEIPLETYIDPDLHGDNNIENIPPQICPSVEVNGCDEDCEPRSCDTYMVPRSGNQQNFENANDDCFIIGEADNSNETSNLREINYSADISSFHDTTTSTMLSERIPWEKHSNGFATKMLRKMGHTEGKGLGKHETGIIEPIKITDRQKPTVTPKKIFILSDSMFNKIEANRLSKKFDVTLQYHGGCTVKCMYSHLTEAIKCNADYVILHVGTNDCCTKTSDEVLEELKKLKNFIENLIPSTKVIISLPTIRSDNSRANIIIKHLNLKLKRLELAHLDNSNINESHLGRKGLHFNQRGIKCMAKNIITLIKQL